MANRGGGSFLILLINKTRRLQYAAKPRKQNLKELKLTACMRDFVMKKNEGGGVGPFLQLGTEHLELSALLACPSSMACGVSAEVHAKKHRSGNRIQKQKSFDRGEAFKRV